MSGYEQFIVERAIFEMFGSELAYVGLSPLEYPCDIAMSPEKMMTNQSHLGFPPKISDPNITSSWKVITHYIYIYTYACT